MRLPSQDRPSAPLAAVLLALAACGRAPSLACAMLASWVVSVS